MRLSLPESNLIFLKKCLDKWVHFNIELLKLLEDYFKVKGWKNYFLSGGCYWFAEYLNQRIYNSVRMINRMEEHCAIQLSNGLYDVRGKISPYGFHVASEREISFMKKIISLNLM